MMTIGKPVSASGAEAYFKADLAEQKNNSKTNSEEKDGNGEGRRVSPIAEAENLPADRTDSQAVDSNTEIIETDNADFETEAIEKESGEKALDEQSPAKTSGIENSISKKSVNEELNFVADPIDFARQQTRWVGKLTEELGLKGEVTEKEFAALCRGNNPQTGEQFIRHVKPRTITDEKGKTYQTKSHRAGVDQTLNAPKSVSLVAPYDERVVIAHWRSAIKAVEAIEEFTTAKMGNVKTPEKTGKAAYAAFLHFEARPDFKNGFAAPDLHTHFFELNFTSTTDGRHRALETREIYRCQKLGTAVYRAELIKEMTKIGYEMRIDEKTGAPEVASISREYIEASSPRQKEIKETAAELGIKSTKIVASNYRRGKDFDPVEMRGRWREMDEKFGNQAVNAAAKARLKTEELYLEKQLEEQTSSSHQPIAKSLNTEKQANRKSVVAVDFALTQAREQRNAEKSKQKWITRQSLLTDALTHSLAEITIDEVKAEFTEREKTGELEEFALDRRGTKNPSKLEEVSEKVSIEEKQVIQSETNETELNINKEGKKLEKLIENNYDETGTLQSGTGTDGSRNQQVEISNDTNGNGNGNGNNNHRSFRDGELHGGKISLGSSIAGFDVVDAAADSDELDRSNGVVNSGLARFGEEFKQQDSDSGTGNQRSQKQNSFSGERERELPDRSGSSGSGKLDDGRIIGKGSDESGINGETASINFKSGTLFDDGNTFKEKSNFQTKTVEMEKTSRIESDADLAEIKLVGTKSAPVRDNRTDDEATGSRQTVTGNETENISADEGNSAENTVGDSKGEGGTRSGENRNNAVEKKHRNTESAAETSREADGSRRTDNEGNGQEISDLSNWSGKTEITNSEGSESEGFAGARISDRSQRAAGKRNLPSSESDIEIEQASRFDSAADSKSEGVSNFKRAESGKKSRVDSSHLEVGDRAVDFIGNGSGLLLLDEQRPERESGGGKDHNEAIKPATRASPVGKNDDRAEFQQHDYDTSTNIPGSRENLQSARAGTTKDNSISIETNRRTAEKTAQIINVKRFSGGLDPQIVAEWTAIIEKSNAAKFLSEVIKPQNSEQEQKVFEQLDLQAVLIAGKLDLPKPEAEPNINRLKLAVALTEIEVANYEKTSGEPLADKVFEAMVEDKLQSAVKKPLPEQVEQLQKTFGDTSGISNLNLLTALEVETLNALLAPDKTGFDAAEIGRAQQSVNTNEAAARETAALIQIAYGGQANKFTDDFKCDLAEQIYYAPTPAIDTYQNFRQFDWQQTIENFAPTVNYLAEQSKIEIKPPESDLERNKQLADFVAQQIVEAYARQNSPLEKYVQNEFVKIAMQAGNLEVSQSQKDTIAALTDQKLEPPEFSRALEASASYLTKYDDEKKVSRTSSITDQIREAALVKAQKQAPPEIGEAQVFSIR